MKMNHIETKKLTGIIRVETGLHIGAGNDTIEIGGIDNPVVKHPFTKEPYIPGSSLKGKMRSLMEWKLGKVGSNNGAVCSCGECPVCRVFGTALSGNEAKAKALRQGPSRLIVRDAFVTAESRKKFREEDMPMLEEKKENFLNRITAAAMPRSLERVVPGLEFGFEILYKIIDTEDGGAADKTNWSDVVLTALALVRADALGGGSSRGSGKVEFLSMKDEAGNEVSLPTV
jgi:CRISPR-associated protein Csm3